MAKTITSVLLVDFDSLRRSLDRIDPVAGGMLAERADDLLEALERGDLITPRKPRRILIRRCFVDPDRLGGGSVHLAAAGFDIVEYPRNAGGRSSADVHLTIDAVDALRSDTAYDEFIILSAESDLAPLLMRLKGDNRLTAMYADGPAGTSTSDHLANGHLAAEALVEFVVGDDPVAPETMGRDKIEALARRVCAATNIPLLSPKSYGELFRQLAREVATNGYDFQTTAREVAARLSEAGRNVSRRQVLFVVKGLALKGHVFSADDTAETLAGVFLEQARYLIANAGIDLGANEERLLHAWLVARARNRRVSGKKAAATPDAKKKRKPAKRARKPAPTPEPAKVEAKQPSDEPSAEPAKPTKRARKSAPIPPPPKVEAEQPEIEPPAEAVASGDEPSAPELETSASLRKGRSAEEIRAEIAARISRTLRERETARTTAEASDSDAPKAAKPKKTGRKTPASDGPPADAASGDLPDEAVSLDPAGDDEAPLEDSILAAIAEAVDVLVESSGGTPTGDGQGQPEPQPAQPASDRPAEEPAPEDVEGEDIGDEIQRIIASYDRDRD